MQDKYDYDKHRTAVETYQLAVELRKKGDLPAAIETVKIAGKLFHEIHNRDMCVETKSYELKWLYESNRNTFYEEHEGGVLNFLEEFNDRYSHPSYIITQFHYLKYKAKRFTIQRDFINARDALSELAELASNNKSALRRISDNQIQIWLAQIKELEAQASRARKDNLATQAQYYLDAANLSTPVEHSDPLAEKMRLFKYSFLSTHYKLKGFSLLRVGKTIDFEQLVDNMRSSLEYAEKAYELSQNELLKQHKTYISYWLNVFSARNAMAKTEFDLAIKHLNQAIGDAKHLEDKGVTFFPNYYEDFEHLCADRLFVRAYQLLYEGDFRKSFSKLEKWLPKNEKKKGTWKYNTIKLRFLAVQILMKLDTIYGGGGKGQIEARSYEISAAKLREEIDPLMKEVSLGKASEKIAEIIVFLAVDHERKQLTLDNFGNAVEKICELFPTDSVIEDYDGMASLSLIGKREPIELIPDCFSKELERISRLKDPERAVQSLDNLLWCYTLISVDYYYSKYLNYAESDRVQPLPLDFDSSFEQMSLEQLTDKLYNITNAFKKNNEALEPLKHYISAKKDPKGGGDLLGLLEIAKQAIIRSSLAFFPHIIRVISGPKDDVKKSETLEEYYICQRMWKKEWPRELLFGAEWPLCIGQFYYLRPRWKNFNFEKAPPYRPDMEIYESRLYGMVEENLRQQDEIERQKNLIWLLPSLEEKMKRLQDLIQRNETEPEIGKFLTENHWVFGRGCKTFIREARIDLKNRSDYYLVTSRDEKIIVEIKRPGVILFQIEKEPSTTSVWPGEPQLCPSQELNMGINQLRRYQTAWKEQAFLELGRHGLSYKPKGILLVGNTKDDTEKEKLLQIKEEERKNLREIMTYDDLLSEAKGVIAFLRELLEQK